MKKILSMGLIAMLLTMGMALAETSVDTTWTGGGSFETHVYSGDDAETHFWTGGNAIAGEFHATDSDNNPYTYGVDNFNTWSKASVANGGFIESDTYRTDSKESMYGDAGQRVYSYIESTDMAEYAYNTNTNYASMTNNQYGKPTWTTNGYQLEATGSSFYMKHQLTDADGDGANLIASGSGFGATKLMASTAGGSAFNFGHLGVAGHGEAWDDNFAKYDGEGVGTVTLNAWADNGLDLHDFAMHVPGDGSDDSAQAHLQFTYAGDFNFKDFGVKGN